MLPAWPEVSCFSPHLSSQLLKTEWGQRRWSQIETSGWMGEVSWDVRGALRGAVGWQLGLNVNFTFHHVALGSSPNLSVPVFHRSWE